MKKNLGTSDRIIRVIIAVVLAGLFVSGAVTGTLGIVLFVIALILIFTTMMSRCPIYAIFGVNSCKTEKKLKNI